MQDKYESCIRRNRYTPSDNQKGSSYHKCSLACFFTWDDAHLDLFMALAFCGNVAGPAELCLDLQMRMRYV